MNTTIETTIRNNPRRGANMAVRLAEMVAGRSGDARVAVVVASIRARMDAADAGTRADHTWNREDALVGAMNREMGDAGDSNALDALDAARYGSLSYAILSHRLPEGDEAGETERRLTALVGHVEDVMRCVVLSQVERLRAEGELARLLETHDSMDTIRAELRSLLDASMEFALAAGWA